MHRYKPNLWRILRAEVSVDDYIPSKDLAMNLVVNARYSKTIYTNQYMYVSWAKSDKEETTERLRLFDKYSIYVHGWWPHGNAHQLCFPLPRTFQSVIKIRVFPFFLTCMNDLTPHTH